VVRQSLNNEGRQLIFGGHEMKRENKGVTLIELVTVIVLLGILVAVAVPAYNNVLEESHETEAKNILSLLHMGEKIFFLTNKTYFAPRASLSVGSSPADINTALKTEVNSPQFYNVTFHGVTASTYCIQASRDGGGTTYRINQTDTDGVPDRGQTC
jgi:type IV pilus assembly protein PilE